MLLGVTVDGTMQLLAPVIAEMQRRGWQTTIALSSTAQAELVENYPDLDFRFVRMSRAITPTKDLRALTAWIRLISQVKPDIVIGSTPKAALLSMIAARANRTPVRIFQIRGARWDGSAGRSAKILKGLDRITASNATHVIAVSESAAHLFHEEKVTKRRPTVIGRGGSKGVDTTRFHPDAARGTGPPTLGFVGRLSKDKGIQDVIAVFEYVKQVHQDCRLIVVGAVDPSQPITAELEQRLNRGDIEWVGRDREVAPWMQQFDVLVFPSVREGLPNVVIEAAACGVPTVAYDTTGVRDAVEPGVNGLLVPLGNTTLLAEAALQLLEPAANQTFSQSARLFAEEHFAQELVVGGFVDHVEQIIASKQHLA